MLLAMRTKEAEAYIVKKKNKEAADMKKKFDTKIEFENNFFRFSSCLMLISPVWLSLIDFVCMFVITF